MKVLTIYPLAADSMEKQSNGGEKAYSHIHVETEDSRFAHARHIVVAQVSEFRIHTETCINLSSSI